MLGSSGNLGVVPPLTKASAPVLADISNPDGHCSVTIPVVGRLGGFAGAICWNSYPHSIGPSRSGFLAPGTVTASRPVCSALFGQN